jgi:hypothetical protein
MVDVAEWPKWLNDVVTKLDASSCEVGPSAAHASARISPTLRKELRDHCIELHQCHAQRSLMRRRLALAVECLEGIAGTKGAECAYPRVEAAEALRAIQDLGL